jgi:hypothetical protein
MARLRAIKLLEIMPHGMRGDFAYIAANGAVSSNLVNLPAKVNLYQTRFRIHVGFLLPTPSSPNTLRKPAELDHSSATTRSKGLTRLLVLLIRRAM